MESVPRYQKFEEKYDILDPDDTGNSRTQWLDSLTQLDSKGQKWGYSELDLKSNFGEIGFNSLPYGDPGQSAGMASGRNRGKDILHQVSGLGPSKPTDPVPSPRA